MAVFRDKYKVKLAQPSAVGEDLYLSATPELLSKGWVSSDNGLTFDIMVSESDRWSIMSDCTYTQATNKLSRGTLIKTSDPANLPISFTVNAIVENVLTAEKMAEFLTPLSVDYVTVKDFGAIGDGVTDDTVAIQSAINAIGIAGGGEVRFESNTYLVSNAAPGAASWDNMAALFILYNNVRLVGLGSSTKIKLKAASNCHVIKIGSRVTSIVAVTGCGVLNMEIDGNRLNQTLSLETETTNHWQGIDVSDNCNSTTLRDLYIHDCMHYAIGFQRSEFINCTVENVVLENTGGDALDWKNDTGNSYGNILRNARAKNFGLSTFVTSPQAGFDLRSGIIASELAVQGMTGAALNGGSGIRLQNGTPGETPKQPTSVDGFLVVGDGDNTRNGVRVITRYGKISNGRVTSVGDGLSMTDPDCKLRDIVLESNNVGARFWQNTGAGVEADTNVIVGLTVRGNAQAGIICDSVDELNFIGCDVRGANGIGYDIRAGCTNIRIIGGSLTGNTTNLSDAGSQTFIQGVSGFSTAKQLTASIAIDSTGTKSITIAHGLPYTPNISHVRLQLKRNTNIGDWSVGFLWATSSDATNINGQIRVLTASATVGAVVDVVAIIDNYRIL